MAEPTLPAPSVFPNAPALTDTLPADATDARDIGQLPLWHLIGKRFLRNRLAVGGGCVLLCLYAIILFAEFVAPYDHLLSNEDFVARAPQLPRFVDAAGTFHWRPFVYGTTTVLDTHNLDWVHENDTTRTYPLQLFVKGQPYKLWGLIPADRHLYGVAEPGTVFLLGTDRLGRDLFSRIVFGGRISMTVGLLGVSLTIILGSLTGTASGYFGGIVDTVIQRTIELLMSFPSIALWAALAAALPADITIVGRFFLISVILSLIGWTSLSRQVRAKVLAFREMEFTAAATAAGATHLRIILVHMLPNTLSHIIVIATLAIPGMILAETALSFLGLGILPPAVSWGTLLRDAQTVGVVIKKPWLMLPGVCVIMTVLSFNFLGDGIRDAVDPFAL